MDWLTSDQVLASVFESAEVNRR